MPYFHLQTTKSATPSHLHSKSATCVPAQQEFFFTLEDLMAEEAWQNELTVADHSAKNSGVHFYPRHATSIQHGVVADLGMNAINVQHADNDEEEDDEALSLHPCTLKRSGAYRDGASSSVSSKSKNKTGYKQNRDLHLQLNTNLTQDYNHNHKPNHSQKEYLNQDLTNTQHSRPFSFFPFSSPETVSQSAKYFTNDTADYIPATDAYTAYSLPALWQNCSMPLAIPHNTHAQSYVHSQTSLLPRRVVQLKADNARWGDV